MVWVYSILIAASLLTAFFALHAAIRLFVWYVEWLSDSQSSVRNANLAVVFLLVFAVLVAVVRYALFINGV